MELNELLKELDRWIKRAEILQITEINSFLKLIRSDLEAVKNAIKYDYSNGPAEGHNNKINKIIPIHFGLIRKYISGI